MDKHVIVQTVCEGEEVMVSVEKYHLVINLMIGMMYGEYAFFGVCVHGGRCGYNLNYRKHCKM